MEKEENVKNWIQKCIRVLLYYIKIHILHIYYTVFVIWVYIYM